MKVRDIIEAREKAKGGAVGGAISSQQAAWGCKFTLPFKYTVNTVYAVNTPGYYVRIYTLHISTLGFLPALKGQPSGQLAPLHGAMGGEDGYSDGGELPLGYTIYVRYW